MKTQHAETHKILLQKPTKPEHQPPANTCAPGPMVMKAEGTRPIPDPREQVIAFRARWEEALREIESLEGLRSRLLSEHIQTLKLNESLVRERAAEAERIKSACDRASKFLTGNDADSISVVGDVEFICGEYIATIRSYREELKDIAKMSVGEFLTYQKGLQTAIG